MREIGVDLNLSKSLLSPTGKVVEFAKRTLYKGVNVSPIPIKELFSSIKSSQSSLQFAKKYSLSPSSFLRLFGAGYKVLGRLQSPFFRMGSK